MSGYYLQTDQLIGIYIPFLMVSVYIFFSDLNRHSSARHGGVFTFMCFNVIGWLVCEMASFLIEDAALYMFVGNTQLVFALFSITGLFLFAYWFFRTDYKMPPYVIMLFFAFPLVFAFMALSPLYFMALELHGRLSQGYSGIVVPVIDYIIPGWGLWLFASTAYSYLMIAAALLIALQGHFLRPRFNRLPSALIIGAIIFTIIGNAVAIFGINPTNLNSTIIAVTISLILYHMAMLTHSHSFYARYARLQAFNFLKDFVLILGKNGQISDFNYSASRWFSSLGIDLRKFTLESAIDEIVELGATVTPAPRMGLGHDISYVQNGFQVILNMQIFDMMDRRNRKHGSIVFFFDVTQNRELFEKLEKKAGVDPLSGLPNRMAYDGAKIRYDSLAHLPLSIIVCDLNGLKTTNDTLGHKYGDLLIQTASRILESACQRPNFVARIGGDEFIILLSQTDEQAANELVNDIKSTMAASSKTLPLPFEISMAMGVATKYDEWESLEDTIVLADNRMYQDKRIMKGGTPQR